MVLLSEMLHGNGWIPGCRRGSTSFFPSIVRYYRHIDIWLIVFAPVAASVRLTVDEPVNIELRCANGWIDDQAMICSCTMITSVYLETQKVYELPR
jgi:hypothetical protein